LQQNAQIIVFSHFAARVDRLVTLLSLGLSTATMAGLEEAVAPEVQAEAAVGQQPVGQPEEGLPHERLKMVITGMLNEGGMEQMKVRKFMKLLARKLGVAKEQLEEHRDFIKTTVKEHWAPQEVALTPAQRMAALVDELGGEAENSKQVIHFVTISRVLPDTLDATDLVDITQMTSQQTLSFVSLFLVYKKAMSIVIFLISCTFARPVDLCKDR
jgi:hypothetical protein